MPSIDSGIAPLALITPNNGFQQNWIIGWTGTHVQARAACLSSIAGERAVIDDRIGRPVVTHCRSIIRFVLKEETVNDKRRASEVVIHTTPLLIAHVSFEDAVEENGMSAQIIGHSAAAPIGQVVFEGAIDKGGHRSIHSKRRWKDLCYHVVDAAAFPSLVTDKGAISNRWGNLVIEHAGAGPNIRAP